MPSVLLVKTTVIVIGLDSDGEVRPVAEPVPFDQGVG